MSMHDPTPRQERIAAFVGALERLDAAGRARLKRNAGNSLAEARDVQRVFFQALPYDVPEREYDDFFLVATLFPLAESRTDQSSLGATMRRIRQNRESGSLDRRFQALLDSNREQLPFRLRQAVRLANASDQSIDWGQLLSDVLAWELEGRPVQLRWAKHYFVGRLERESAESTS